MEGGVSALHIASHNLNAFATIQKMVEGGAKIEQLSDSGESALSIAIQNND